MMREFITKVMFGRLARGLDIDQPDLRAALCGSQIVGLAMVRYVIRLEPMASAHPDVVASAIGPTLQRYLTAAL